MSCFFCLPHQAPLYSTSFKRPFLSSIRPTHPPIHPTRIQPPFSSFPPTQSTQPTQSGHSYAIGLLLLFSLPPTPGSLPTPPPTQSNPPTHHKTTGRLTGELMKPPDAHYPICPPTHHSPNLIQRTFSSSLTNARNQPTQPNSPSHPHQQKQAG